MNNAGGLQLRFMLAQRTDDVLSVHSLCSISLGQTSRISVFSLLPLVECAFAGDIASQNEGLHVIGALVSVDGFEV